MTHTKAIYTGKCDVTIKKNSHCSLTVYETKASNFMARYLICSRPGAGNSIVQTLLHFPLIFDEYAVTSQARV